MQRKAFLWLIVGASLAFAWVLSAMYGAILWAVVTAILFAPMQRHLCRITGRPNLAAALTLVTVVVIVILPITILITSLVAEATVVYDRIQSGQVSFGQYLRRILDSLPSWAFQVLDRFGVSDLRGLTDKLSSGLAEVSRVVVVRALQVGQNTFSFLVNLLVMLYLLFFLLRDGQEIYGRIRDSVPLHVDHKRALFNKFAVVIRATVKGNLVVAILQGGLGGLIFWVLGIQAPILWASLMTVLSLLPAVGAAVIWLPVAIYLMASGEVGKGIGLILFGALVISVVDNLVRPTLVGKDTKMPDYLVLVSTLGGISVFGINGFVLGPVIAAIFISVWNIFSEANKERSSPEIIESAEV